MASHGYAKEASKAGTKEPQAPRMPAPAGEGAMVHHIHVDGPHHIEIHPGGDGMSHVQIHLHDGGTLTHNLPSNSESDKE